MGLLCAARLGKVANYGMAGRREEGKSCVLGSVESHTSCKARLMRSACMCVRQLKLYIMRIFIQTSRNQGLSLSKLVDYKYNQLQDREWSSSCGWKGRFCQGCEALQCVPAPWAVLAAGW